MAPDPKKTLGTKAQKGTSQKNQAHDMEDFYKSSSSVEHWKILAQQKVNCEKCALEHSNGQEIMASGKVKESDLQQTMSKSQHIKEQSNSKTV